MGRFFFCLTFLSPLSLSSWFKRERGDNTFLCVRMTVTHSPVAYLCASVTFDSPAFLLAERKCSVQL